jgi:hypothetical protein
MSVGSVINRDDEDEDEEGEDSRFITSVRLTRSFGDMVD